MTSLNLCATKAAASLASRVTKRRSVWSRTATTPAGSSVSIVSCTSSIPICRATCQGPRLRALVPWKLLMTFVHDSLVSHCHDAYTQYSLHGTDHEQR